MTRIKRINNKIRDIRLIRVLLYSRLRLASLAPVPRPSLLSLPRLEVSLEQHRKHDDARPDEETRM